jgi:hypothetical protein
MKPTSRIIIAVPVACVILAIFSACNPVKRILKSELKTREVVDSFIARHPYVNDTIIKFIPGKTDSVPVFVQLRDTLREKVPCDSFTQKTRKGTVVTVDKKGNLTVKNDSLKYYSYIKTDTLQVFIKDRELLIQSQDLVRRQAAELSFLRSEIKRKEAKIGNLQIKFWIVVASGVFLLILNIYKRIKSFFL